MSDTARKRLTDFASCAGCAGKLSQPLLAQVLGKLPSPSHPDLLVGTDTFDDAGVFRIADDLALVQTVDFFPPLVDDPYQFGRIAATNALSDVYAMGGKPLTALCVVDFPDKELPPEILVEILRGGAEQVRAAGAVVVGGHSIRNQDVLFGLSVTGVIHPNRIFTNAAARPGDVLVLTKPLGVGVLTSAAKRGLLSDAGLTEAIRCMTTLNDVAAAVAHEADVRAATDVTGFGLVGHAGSMAKASGVSIRIDSRAAPLLPGTLEFAREGVLTRAHIATREHLGERLVVGTQVEPAVAGIVCDAQTSGGLLLCVQPDRVAALQASLRTRGALAAEVVGRVESGKPGTIFVD